MSEDTGLARCGDCGADLTAPDSVTVYYRIGLAGNCDATGLALPHDPDQIREHADTSEMDTVACNQCSSSLWEQ